MRNQSFFKLAGGKGFEPLFTESESVVLPLNDPPSRLPSIVQSALYVNLFSIAWNGARRKSGRTVQERPAASSAMF